MIPTRFVRFALLAASAGALASCESTLGPVDAGLPEAELTFIGMAADAPPLEATQVSFYVKRGTDREVQIRYAYPGGFRKCLLFRVPGEAPLRRPDGSTLAMGDSVLVTIRVPDPAQFRFEFDPAGLQFDPAHPAELEIRFDQATRDHNGDGTVDAADARIESGIRIWRQERPGERWHPIETIPAAGGTREVRAEIDGFTQYALASDRSGTRFQPDGRE